MPRLENWQLITVYGRELLHGDIYDDHRFPDGENVYTSEVQSIDEKRREATTKNTTYILGEPAKGTRMEATIGAE